jgi:hypothetical protein
MVAKQLDVGRSWLWGTALVGAAVVFWVALHSDGGDWLISETHADIMYTGLRRFGEFPYFSFVFNGGSYFLQDPQSNLFSPVVPLVLLAGPTIGLRLMEAVWGALGVFAFVIWMRRRVSLEAAIVGALASTLSLAMLWRIAMGNDMFMWNLALPALLWAVERVLERRSLESMFCLALALGLLLLGPTFHAFTYLFIPTVLLFVLVEWLFNRLTRRELLRALALLAGASCLALLMASFKLACWAEFPMGRPTGDFGAIPFTTGLRHVFDYSLAQNAEVIATRYLGRVRRGHIGWGIHESSIALPPAASLLALLGVVVSARDRAKWRTACFAISVVVFGFTLACNDPVWELFRNLTGGNFRVASRFLGMTAFGLAVFAALGANAIFARWQRSTRPVTAFLLISMALSALWWTKSAGAVQVRSADDHVNPAAIRPIATYKAERDAASQVRSFDNLVHFGDQREILKGNGYSNGFLVVGNDYDPHRWSSSATEPVVIMGIKPNQLTIEHLRIKIRNMAPRSRIFLRARSPAFGLAVTTDPPDAHVRVREQNSFLVIENRGYSAVNRVVLRAEFPISVFWIGVAILALLGTCAALIALEVSRRNSSQHA